MEQINITAEDMLKRYDKVEKSPNGKLDATIVKSIYQ